MSLPTKLLLGVACWIVLSVPVGLLIGRLIRYGMGDDDQP